MNNQTYLERRNSFIAAQLPFCTVTPQELISTGEHTYEVNGLELAVEPEVCRLLDSYLGLSKHQTKPFRRHSAQQAFAICATTWLCRTALREPGK